jgi:hypothetical protein
LKIIVHGQSGRKKVHPDDLINWRKGEISRLNRVITKAQRERAHHMTEIKKLQQV